VDYSILDDASLIRLIVATRTEALEALYDRYSRLVFSMALHAVGDAATAEEITQDVFVRVWEKASTYRADQAKVSTWLTSITRYRSIDILRYRNSRPEKNSIGWEELMLNAEPSAEGPEGDAELSLDRIRVRSAISHLPPEQQKVLNLAYFLGMSHSQIAEQLKEPLGTVKTRIRLAMLKLREVLQDDVLTAR
jgi:RNA polymerase sigma-70 factor (ECF subfamily)